jgi:hypothetical protein
LTQLAALVGLGLGLGSWFYDTTNWLDVMVISMVGTFAALMSDPNEYEAAIDPDGPWGIHAKSFRAGCAFTKMILWVAVVYFLKSLSINFAVFLDGVVYVVKRLVAFLMAVACILVAFALMFAILYQEEELCDPVLAAKTNEQQFNTTGGCDNPVFPHCEFNLSLLKVSSSCLFATLTQGKFSVAYVCVSFDLRCTQ